MALQLGVDKGERVLLALSGGADSVYLLNWLRRTMATSQILAVHVHHGLRGAASDGDQEFCEELCAGWKVPFKALSVDLGAGTEDLERRAREARYGALAKCARRRNIQYVLTAHHPDDQIETLLMRWMRGSGAPGLVGPQPHSPYPIPSGPGGPLTLLRPLLLDSLRALNAKKIRDELRAEGVNWREDESNRSTRFTRNRIRHQVIPLLQETCGPEILGQLHRFQRTLAEHERLMRSLQPALNWQPRKSSQRPSWRLPRTELVQFLPPLLQRALYVDLLARTGRAPKDQVLSALAQALLRGTDAHWNLRGAWSLQLDGPFLRLKAPPR